jgi:MoxR-like ATPase
LNTISAVMNASELESFRDVVKSIKIEKSILEYIAKIVNTTRNYPALYLGASPRASIAIMKSAQAIAAMQGRDFITPDDVKFITEPVLIHRIMLTPEKEMEGATAAQVIQQIVESVEVPR